jgi:group I intron endonuclease
MKSGIYLITNVINHKEYVGKDKNIPRRRYAHFEQLRAGRHGNPHLQNAYNRYGKQAFHYMVLEYCSPEDLVERERWWMGLLNTLDPHGYNLRSADGHFVSNETRKRMSIARMGRPGYFKGKKHSTETIERMRAAFKGKSNPKVAIALKGRKLSQYQIQCLANRESEEWMVINPDNISTRIRNLSRFCRENNLNASIMAQVAKGRRMQHKGWRCIKPGEEHRLRTVEEHTESLSSRRANCYIVTSPDGLEYNIKNLSKFCVENNLNQSNMTAVSLGKRLHHKGWTCRKLEDTH